jgi:hypothetical protein
MTDDLRQTNANVSGKRECKHGRCECADANANVECKHECRCEPSTPDLGHPPTWVPSTWAPPDRDTPNDGINRHCDNRKCRSLPVFGSGGAGRPARVHFFLSNCVGPRTGTGRLSRYESGRFRLSIRSFRAQSCRFPMLSRLSADVLRNT